MSIIPYKQTLSHSCLVACFLMLLDKKLVFSEKDEKEVCLKGMSRKYPFYVVGIPQEFFNYFRKKVTVFVDNKYFTGFLKKNFDENNIAVKQHVINLTLIKRLLEKAPVICHIDDHYLGDYSHASHFVVIEKATAKKFLVVDPMSGTKKLVSCETLKSAIHSLKTHIKMCPLVFQLD